MGNEHFEEIKRRVLHPNATTLNIKRVPKKEVQIFKDIANEEFLGDYGMLFKQMVNDWVRFREKLYNADDYELIVVNKNKVVGK